jgi:hypothetical protein
MVVFSFYGLLIASVVMMRMTDQLGTPRGRYNEHSSKFSSVRNQGFIIQEKVNTPEGDACKLRDGSEQFIRRLIQALLCER